MSEGKLDKNKKYVFKLTLITEALKGKEEVGTWATTINNQPVQVIEDGARAYWRGMVNYPISQGHQQIPEEYWMEPEWVEEVK